MNNEQLLKIVQEYSRNSAAAYGDITVTRVSDRKTVIVEQMEGMGRTVMLDKYQVEGATYWAGYSSRSETVYISLAA